MDLRDASASKKTKINTALFFAASCGSLTLSPWMNVMQRNNNIKHVCTLGFGFVLCLFFFKNKKYFLPLAPTSLRRQQNWRKRKKLQRTHSCTRFSCTQKGWTAANRPSLPPGAQLQLLNGCNLAAPMIYCFALFKVGLWRPFHWDSGLRKSVCLQKNALGFNKGGCKRWWPKWWILKESNWTTAYLVGVIKR